jgi:hypothetical protein
LQLCLPFSFLLNLLLHDLGSSSHVLLLESKALVFLVKAC